MRGLRDQRVVRGDEHLGHAARGRPGRARRAPARTATRGPRAARPARHHRRCRTRARRARARSTPSPCATTSPANSSPGMSAGEPGGACVEAGALHEIGPVEPGAVHAHERPRRVPVRDRAVPRRAPAGRRSRGRACADRSPTRGSGSGPALRCGRACRRLPARPPGDLVVLDADGEAGGVRRRRGARPPRAHRRPRGRDGLGVPAVSQPDPRGRGAGRPARRRAAVRTRPASWWSWPTTRRRSTSTCVTWRSGARTASGATRAPRSGPT